MSRLLARMAGERNADLRLKAAHATGMAEREIAAAEDTPDGLIVTTIDGNRVIVVPEDRPDGAGISGVMMLDPPTGKNKPMIPVFTPKTGRPSRSVPAPAAPDMADPAASTTVAPEDLATVRDIDRRLETIDAERDELRTEREQAMSTAILSAIDARLRALDDEVTVLRARRGPVSMTEAAAREARSRELEQDQVVAAAGIVLDAAEILGRIDAEVDKLRRLHTAAVEVSMPPRWIRTLDLARQLAETIEERWSHEVVPQAAEVKAGRDPRSIAWDG